MQVAVIGLAAMNVVTLSIILLHISGTEEFEHVGHILMAIIQGSAVVLAAWIGRRLR
jgi:hypothetical protein